MDAPWHPWVNKQPLNQADGVRRLHEPPQDGAGAQIKHSGSSDFTPRHFFFNPLEFHGCIYGNSLFIRPLVLLYMQTPPWDLIICIPVATSEDTEVRSSAKLMVGGSWHGDEFILYLYVFSHTDSQICIPKLSEFSLPVICLYSWHQVLFLRSFEGQTW